MERASLIASNVYVVVFPSGRWQGAAIDHSSSLRELTETVFGAALSRLRPPTLGGRRSSFCGLRVCRKLTGRARFRRLLLAEDWLYPIR